MVTRSDGTESDAARTVEELRELLEARTLEVAELRRKLTDLESRGNAFLAAASHAVMNPLTIIQSYLEVVLSDLGGGLSDQQTGFVKTAHAASLKLHRLIDDLVELAALELGAAELEMSAVQVGDVVSDVCSSFVQAAEKGGLDFSVSITPGLPRVQTEAARLRRAVDAVVSNAVRLTPRGGRVQVTVLLRDNSVVISVEDTGPGIPEDRLDHVFDPFVRLARRDGEPPGGAGLGLSVARRQIEVCGGHIEIASTVGQGCAFSLVIPALADDR